MTKSTVIRHLAALAGRMEDNDFSSKAEDTAIREAMRMLKAASPAPCFTLAIDLGNAEMLTGEHVATALRELAEKLDTRGSDEQLADADPYDRRGSIKDQSGNKVGTWEVAK